MDVGLLRMAKGSTLGRIVTQDCEGKAGIEPTTGGVWNNESDVEAGRDWFRTGRSDIGIGTCVSVGVGLV